MCFNCGSTNLVMTPDSEMRGLTDVVVCRECGEAQDIDMLPEEVINNMPSQGYTATVDNKLCDFELYAGTRDDQPAYCDEDSDCPKHKGWRDAMARWDNDDEASNRATMIETHLDATPTEKEF